MALARYQMRRMARGLDPALSVGPAFALVADQLVQRRALRRYRSWLRSKARPRDAVKSTSAAL
jgi:hypothetical protein